MLNFLTPQNASNFAIFIEKESPCSFFRFSFQAILHFHLKNALIFVDIDKGIHKIKCKIAWNEKRIKLCGVSFSMNMANFEDLGGLKVERKPLFLDVCYIVIKRTFRIPISWKPTGVEKFIMYISGSATSLSPLVQQEKSSR